MKLAKYITFKSGDDLIIAQTAAPHYIGLVSGKKESQFHSIQIPGYELHVSFKGTLEGNFMLMSRLEGQIIESIFEEMALFYYNDRVMKFPDRFKKYKI